MVIDIPRKDEAFECKWSWALELVEYLAGAAETTSSYGEPHLGEKEKKPCHDGEGDGLVGCDSLALCREAHDSRHNTNHGSNSGDDGHFQRVDGPQRHADVFLLLSACFSTNAN